MAHGICRSDDESRLLQPNFKTLPTSYLSVTTKSMQSTHDFMPHRRNLLLGLAGFWVGALAQITPIRVAAASDLKFVLATLAASFERETGLKLTITYGSSGNLARQLEQGLPMDLFLSADEALIERLHKGGWARDAGVVYARGRLAWAVPKDSTAVLDADLKGLRNYSSKLAIANPEHAPYGRAARAALQQAGLWDKLQAQLVLGENVSQAMQFVSTGSAQAAVVALTLASAPELATRIRYTAVNPALHPPIIQRMALQRNAGSDAQRFYEFLQSPVAKRLFQQHGL
jgi:molybdate transport system substrate-binding protein